MVYRRKKVERSTFRKLPTRGVFFKTDGTGPLVKSGRRSVLTANSLPQNAPGGTAVTDTSIAVVRLPRPIHS